MTRGLHLDVTRAHACLQDLQERHFEAFSSVATVIAARTVLNSQRRMVKHLLHVVLGYIIAR